MIFTELQVPIQAAGPAIAPTFLARRIGYSPEATINSCPRRETESLTISARPRRR